MVAFTRPLLLLNLLYLLAHVYAYDDSTNEAVKWLEAGRSVLVHLATPDLHFWNQRDQIATHYPGAFIFNFTLTPDNLTLLLNDEPILPRANPHIPTPLCAPQTGENVYFFAQRVSTNFSWAPVMDLDYYIEAPDTTSGTSIYNTRYNPRIRIDILRASIPTLPGYSTPLASDSQNEIWLWLDDLAAHPPETPYSSIPLTIRAVQVSRRWLNTGTLVTTNYKSLKDLKTCHVWSWLCADIKTYPYYQFIYRENFDQYGKKGSMRHFVAARWADLVRLIGAVRAISWLATFVCMVLLLAVHVVFRGVMSAVQVYRKRVQDVDEWLEDEEVEDGEFGGLLRNETYLEDFGEVKKERIAEGKGSEKTNVEKYLPPPPPYTLMKTEKSVAS